MPSLPVGLPARYTDPETGFRDLCRFLGIPNRQYLQRLAAHQRVRDFFRHEKASFKNLKTAERLRAKLTRFLSDPSSRREIWIVRRKDSRIAFPSFELQALKPYDESEKAPSEEDLRRSLEDIPKTDGIPGKTSEWQTPAVNAWPAIREDISRYDELDEEHREVASAAVFAVATLLDHRGFLEWAAESVDDLEPEFAFALGVEDPSEEDIAEWSRVHDEKWENAYGEFFDFVSAAGRSGVSPDRFDETLRRVEALGRLRDEIVADREAALLLGELFEKLHSILKGAAEKCGAAWLTALLPETKERWKTRYSPVGVEGREAFQADLARLGEALPDALEFWERADIEVGEAEAERQRLASEGSPETDWTIEDRIVGLQERVAAASRRRVEARRRVIEIIAPRPDAPDPPKPRPAKKKARRGKAPDRAAKGKRAETGGEPVAEGPRKGASRRASAERDPANEARPAEGRGRPSKPKSAEPERQPPAHPEERPKEGPRETPKGRPTRRPEGPAGRAPRPPAGRAETGGAAGADEAPARPPPRPRPPAVVPAPEPHREAAAAWTALREGRPGAAFFIARLADPQPDRTPVLPPADLIAATALAAEVRAPGDEFAAALRPILSAIDPEGFAATDARGQDALNLLLFSSTLAPALFAPATGAPSLLRRIHTTEPLSAVYTLATRIADHAERLHGTPLDLSLLRSALGTASREKQLAEIGRQIREWSVAVKAKTNPLPRAAQVLTALLTNGCLADLTEAVASGRPADRGRVERILEELGASRLPALSEGVTREFEALVHHSDRRTGARPINEKALRQLWKHVHPAIEHAHEWLRLVSRSTGERKGYLRDLIVSLRRDLEEESDKALSAISGVEGAAPGASELAAGLSCARAAISTLRHIFDRRAPSAAPPPKPEIVRYGDLALVTALDLGADLRPRPPFDRGAVLEVLLDREGHAATRSAAFRGRLARVDLVGAGLALSTMEARGDDGTADCRRDLIETAERRRFTLNEELAKETARIEGAFCQGRLGDERNDLAARLVSLAQALAAPGRPGEPGGGVVEAVVGAERELEEIRRAAETMSAERIAAARRRLEELPESADRRGLAEARAAIDAGHLLTAHEYLLQLEQGESFLRPATEPSPFQEFVSQAAVLDETLPRYDPERIIAGLSRRQGLAGIRFGELDGEQAERGARLLKAWYRLAAKRAYDQPLLQRFLEELGFTGCRVSGDRGTRSYLGFMEFERLADRDLCPSRQFGSEADGRYRLLLNWAPNVEEAITRSVGVSGDSPTLALHFGCLGASREGLRRLALRDQRLFLVLDHSLAVFLASRGSGLSAFFRTALPFTSADPYAPTSGAVPPELFYGRERERRDIADRSGACFIYGGRQLGKTALLRRVENDFNETSGHVALWIDLKVHEIGYARGPRDIWPLIRDGLSERGVLSRRRGQLDPANLRHIETLLQAIAEWIAGRKDRRLLLLLDEADEFLAQDAGSDFRESARLKGLMDRTDRRFKVVFSGLHNVLRTTQQANHPLAHLGEPVRVGPMLGGRDERKSAEALVRQPLEAAGCRFERDDLIHRVLAQTNYYPSLIQLYGAELARRVRDLRKPFPYLVSDAELDEAYGSSELRDAIRERFLLTLQLDPRYEVIAYALAFELKDHPVLNDGMGRDEIRDAVEGWWPDGFRISDIEFHMLLEEMDGLGVLRSPDGSRYTLRNPNVLLLLGNTEQIEKNLDKPRSLPATYEPASFRARYPREGPRAKRRGPLTYQQEDRLRRPGVAVITGNRAAGLAEVEAFLSQRSEQRNGVEEFRVLPRPGGLDDFVRRLGRISPPAAGVSVNLVPLDTRWNTQWLDAARQFCRTRRNSLRIRVVFQADPEQLWRLEDEFPVADWPGIDRIEVRPCDAVFVRSWLDDVNLQHDEETIAELLEVTGGWPAGLFELNTGPTKDWSFRIAELRKKAARMPSGEQLGLASNPAAAAALRRLAELEEPFSQETIELLAEDSAEAGAAIRRQVEWARRLGLVEAGGTGVFRLNPLVRSRLAEFAD